MIPTTPATNLKDAWNAFDPTSPLTGRESFYVKRGGGVEQLLSDLRDDSNAHTKILFSGQRGSGKSTELKRLGYALNESHFVVYFDIEDALDPADIDYRDLLVTLGIKLFRMSVERKLGLSESLRNDLVGWFKTIVDERAFESAGGLGGDAAADLFFAKISGKLQAEAHTRRTLRTQTESRLSDLFTHLNRLCDEIHSTSGRHVVAIIDGLDRIMQTDRAVNLFATHASSLMAPHCKIVFTVPLSIYYTKDMGPVRVTFHKDFMLPNLKPHDRAGRPYAPDRALMAEMVRRRMASPLITDAALDRLCTLSGGIIRELVSLAKESISHARTLGAGQVDALHVGMAADAIRNRYRGMLTLEDRAELLRRFADKQKIGGAVTQQLLHSLALIEYTNGENWYDVHPVLWSLIAEWQHNAPAA